VDPLTLGPDGRPLLLAVTAIDFVGRDTKRFRLASADGAPLPPISAGAHLVLELPTGAARQYSIIHPGSGLSEYAVAVRKEDKGRGGSAWMHDCVSVGDRLEVSSVRNDFPLAEQAPNSLLIGGGIGVTPLIAMAEALRALGRSFTFYAAFRSRDHLLLAEELTRIGGTRLHFDAEAGELLPLKAIIAAAPRDSHLYCCGPAEMIASFLQHAREDGRDEEVIHYEYFSAPAAPPQDGTIEVELARSGVTILVPPGQSILDAVREAGIPANSSCEQGTCGACEVKVLEGEPDHFDAVLTPKERKNGDRMMICCSGALSRRLVLDI
jgi:ferredoxin-NADP reductase